MEKSVQITELPKSKRGPKTAEGKARALANLRPAWQPGDVPNPAGRPNAGAAVAEWFNQMQGWSLEQLEATAADPDSPAAKVTAAKQWLAAMSGNGTAVDRICDRTDGKPTQPVDHRGAGEVRNCTTDELLAIRDILAAAGRRAGQPEPGRN